MSSELEKFLAKISLKEEKVLGDTIEKIIEHRFTGLDIKKLSGHEDTYRVRKGVFRIIFKITAPDVKIVMATRRGDTTYNLD